MTVPPLRSYGRVLGRPLKPNQTRLLDELLPRLALPLPLGALDPAALLPGAERVVLEIGFGGGEHLVAQARAAPNAGFIGVEPFLNGVGVALRLIEEAGLANVRLHNGDARDVVAALPEASLDRIDILFPDPWPKKKHWKRRLVQPAFAHELARVLKPGGELRFATDWKNYAATALDALFHEPGLEWTARGPADWRAPWEGHVTTRYEAKKLGDTAPIWLRFVRRSAS